MKSYKISQTIEKNLYPIEAKLDEIKESQRKTMHQLVEIYSPVFISAILTVSFGESVFRSGIPLEQESSLSFFETLFHTWWGKSLYILGVFIVFAAVSFLLFKWFHMIADRRDNKGTYNKRKQIAKDFYKVIIPEIITGVSLFERAYEIELAATVGTENTTEIDAEKITVDPTSNTTISNKAVLYYYEAFYHFKLVADGIEKDQLLEYKYSDRENLEKLYEIIGRDALKKAVQLSFHCVKEIRKRIVDAQEEELEERFAVFNRSLLSKEPNGFVSPDETSTQS